MEEIQREAASWVRKCQYGAVLFVTLWIGWIVTAQILRKEGALSPSWFFLNSDDAELTGW
jgi:hypothetical protein